MKKKVLALLVAIALIASAVIVAVPQASAAEHANHCLCGDGKADELPESNHTCADATWTAWTKTDSLPASGNYYLTGNVTLSAIHEFTGSANLCLNGYTITGPATGGVLRMTAEGSYGICDCSTAKTGKIVALNTENCYNSDLWGGQAISIAAISKLYLYSGTITMSKDAKEFAQSGLISVEKNSTTPVNGTEMYLYNAVVTGGKAQFGGNFSHRWNRNGKFYMYGGEISNGYAFNTGRGTEEALNANNKSDKVTVSGGGNIFNQYYYFHMWVYGGKIINGKTETGDAQQGGNIHLMSSDSRLYLYDGAIISGGTAHYGGNIAVRSGKLYMYGGLVANGTGRSAANIALGVTGASPTAEISGGTIVGGQATLEDGYGAIGSPKKGVATLTISGNAKIYGNINSNGAAADVDVSGLKALKFGTLTEGAKIGLNNLSSNAISDSTVAEGSNKYIFLNGSKKVAAVVEGKLTAVSPVDGYNTLQDAIDADVTNITLRGNLTTMAQLKNDVVINNGDYVVAIDLNGKTADVKGNGLVTVADSAATYTETAGTIIAANVAATSKNAEGKRYAAFKQQDGSYEVLRFYIGVTDSWLNAAEEGLSFKVTANGEVEKYGVIISIKGVEGEYKLELTDGASKVMLKNFFENNLQKANITVKAYAVVNGEEIISGSYKLNFATMIEEAKAEEKYETLTADQKALVDALYTKIAPPQVR